MGGHDTTGWNNKIFLFNIETNRIEKVAENGPITLYF